LSSLFAGNLVQNKTPMLAYVGTDDAVQFSKKFPVTAVVSPLAKHRRCSCTTRRTIPI